MGLIICPDCKKSVSDQARKCIHCGRALTPSLAVHPPKTSQKRPASNTLWLCILVGVLAVITITYMVHRHVEARQHAEQQRIAQALDALKALRSMTQAGLSYRDYIPRLADTQVQIDRYLQTGTNSAVKAGLANTMGIYKLASSAWQV
ncbi:MAG: hypothetical protein ABSD47_12715 [Candidatus Methylomirabilota bacterium]